MSVIYAPAGRAREYAALACNIYRGCDHRCTYCYAPSATRRKRENFAVPETRSGFIRQLERDAERVEPGEIILLCFTCDAYQHLDVELAMTRDTIKILHRAGHAIHVLTKGGSRALRDLDLFTDQDAFATSLTLLSSKHTTKWEPGAASPQDRIDTIRKFHAAGIPTWVSLEPVLNPSSSLALISETHTFVDLYKVGKLNHHKLAATIDWHEFVRDAVALLKSYGKKYYIKKDLACYLESK